MNIPRHKNPRYLYYASHSHLTKTEMAKQLGIPRDSVDRALKRFSLPSEPEVFGLTDERQEMIRRNFRKMRYHLLARLCGIGESTVRYFLKREGLVKQIYKTKKMKQAA